MTTPYTVHQETRWHVSDLRGIYLGFVEAATTLDAPCATATECREWAEGKFLIHDEDGHRLGGTFASPELAARALCESYVILHGSAR